MRAVLKKALRVVIDFVAPPKCLTCHAAIVDPASLCLSCWSKLNHIDWPVCDVLGTPFAYDQGDGAVSAPAVAAPPNWDRARSAVGYDEASRNIVHALKYRDTMEAGLLMARLMKRAGATIIRDADVVVPVPLHRWRLWGRRFNQAAYLAQQITNDLTVECRTDVLGRVKASRSQVGLKADERRKNVAKVFEITPENLGAIAGRRVLLVDDVMTTGATAASCAAVLKTAGATHVDVLTFALVLGPMQPHIE